LVRTESIIVPATDTIRHAKGAILDEVGVLTLVRSLALTAGALDQDEGLLLDVFIEVIGVVFFAIFVEEGDLRVLVVRVWHYRGLANRNIQMCLWSHFIGMLSCWSLRSDRTLLSGGIGFKRWFRRRNGFSLVVNKAAFIRL